MTHGFSARVRIRPAFLKCLVIAGFILGYINLNAQNFFSELEENLVYYSPDIAPTAVCVGDFEADGDQDILSFFNGKFRLYNHANGEGAFSEQEIISAPDDWILSVFLADLNADGKQDIIAASYNNDCIVWYENEGGLVFGARNVITDAASGAISVHVADLDQDGDPDILSASLWDNTIAWYENDGTGSFGDRLVITNQCPGARFVYVSDVNGDGLPDVLSASIYDNRIAWYENEGAGIFGSSRTISGNVVRPLCIYTADLDGDHDQDVLSASSWDNKIAWYENDGQGSFGDQQVISQQLKDAQSVFAADLDNDGDQDVISASLLDDKIAWYENRGDGYFGGQQVVSGSADMPGFVYADDVDGDGYLDIISASTDFKIAWYANTLPLRILANPEDTAVYPGKDAAFRVLAESATGYRWQYNPGSTYIDLSDSEVYSGAETDRLEITGASYNLQGNRYRCVVINGQDSLHSAAAILTVLDTIQPVFSSGHPDITLSADEACYAAMPDFTRSVATTDNSGDTVFVTQDPLPFSWVSGDGAVLTLTATDPSGNSSQVSFFVDVEDQTPPAYQLAEIPELDTNANGHFVLPDYSGMVVVTDNCSDGSAILVTQDPAPFFIIPDTVFVVEVSLTMEDAAGNRSAATFSVATRDVVPPEITSVHQDTILEGNFDCVAYVPDFTGMVEATDNTDAFSELTISQLPEPYTIIFGNENTITLYVQDQSGNTAEAAFNVKVSSELPTIACIEDQILDLGEGQTSYTVSGIEFDPAAVTFQCGYGDLSNSINGSSTLDLVEFLQDTTLVVWTLTDDVGNVAECSFNVVLNQWVGTEDEPALGFSVYPNPTTGSLHFECAFPVSCLRMLDVTGKILVEKTDLPCSGAIDMTGFQRGSYILSISSGAQVFKKLIVKE